MAVAFSRLISRSLLLAALLSFSAAVPAQPKQGTQVEGDLGERRWDRRMAERFESMARRAEALRLAGKCEEFYRARGEMSFALANAEHSIRETAKFNPAVTGAMWDTHRYYTGYYYQLMGLECPPRAAVADAGQGGAVSEPATGSSQDNRSQPRTEQQQSEKVPPEKANESAGTGEQGKGSWPSNRQWPSKYDPSDLNAKNSETAMEQLEIAPSGIEVCEDSEGPESKCGDRPSQKPKPQRDRSKPQ